MASKSLGTLSLDLIVQTGGFADGMDKAERIADAKTRSIERLARERAKGIESAFSGMAKSIAGPLAAAFSVNAFAGMLKGSIEAQDKINDLSKSTSISVATLAGLGSAARKSGGDLDSIAASVNKLSINMGKDPLKFAALGISAKDPLEALKQLSDVFVAIRDPQERAAFAAAALGKSWAGTAPLLAEGGAAIGEMVEKGTRLSKITKESAEAADRLNDQLEDLKTTSDGVKTAFANLLVPSLNQTARAMDDLVTSGNPVLALLRGFAGLGKIPWDLALGDVDMTLGGQVKDLEEKLTTLQAARAKAELAVKNSGSSLSPVVEKLSQQIAVVENQIAAFQKFGDKIGKGKPLVADQGSPNLRTNPDVRGFLDDDTAAAKAIAAQVSETQRLIEQLKARLITTENLTEVEKLQAQLADTKYAKATAGERSIAQGLAAQIDAHKGITAELDVELARMRDITQEYDAQAAASKNRLAGLIGNTDHGQAAAKLIDEATAESALRSGEINLETYDQIIAKLGEVKDAGKDTFAGLQSAIEGWGNQSADAITQFCLTGKLSFSDMTRSIIADMMKMVIQQNITGPMAKAVGSGWEGAGGWLSGLFKSDSVSMLGGGTFAAAKGAVFPGAAGLSAYSGNIVSSPTLFPFAKGMGLMGEAGPEAVMPLSRGSDGKLGVKASGGSGDVQVNITITDNSTTKQNATGDTTGAWTQFAGRIKGMILDEMTTQKRPGGLLYN